MIVSKQQSAAKIPEQLEALGLQVVTPDEAAGLKEECTRRSAKRWRRFLAKNSVRIFYFGSNPEVMPISPIAVTATAFAVIAWASIAADKPSVALCILAALFIIFNIELVAFGLPGSKRWRNSIVQWALEAHSKRPVRWEATPLADYVGQLPEPVRILRQKVREIDFAGDDFFVHHTTGVRAPGCGRELIFIELRLYLKAGELSYFGALQEPGEVEHGN